MTMQRESARRLFQAGIVALVASLAAAGYVACSGNTAPTPDAGVDLTHRSSGQIITPPGLGRVVTSGGILAGSGTTSNPLTATLSVSGSISGTGSAGSPLTSSSTVSTTSPVTGTGSAGSPVTTSFTDTSPFQGTGSAGSPFSIATNGISNTLIRQSVGVSVIGRSANSTGNVADITASADGQVLLRAGGALTFTTLAANTPTFGIFGDGSDGNLHFDGTSTVFGIAPSGSLPNAVYTLTNHEIFAQDLTVDSGVTLQIAATTNWPRIFVNGTLTLNGKISADGQTGAAGGGGSAGNLIGAGVVTAGTGGLGTTGTNINPNALLSGAGGAAGATSGGTGGNGTGTGTGGGGGGGAAGVGFAGGSQTISGVNIRGQIRSFTNLLSGRYQDNTAWVVAGAGGGGGGNSSSAGRGGGGGGVNLLIARIVAGSGSQTANGGNGGTTGNTNLGGGGGGGGGVTILIYQSGNPFTQTATAGTGAAGNGTGGHGGNGANGITMAYNL